MTPNLDIHRVAIWKNLNKDEKANDVMLSLSRWAAGSDATVHLWEDTAGMARKVLRPLRDGEALQMQIGCENEKRKQRMCQHLCFSYGKWVSVWFIYSQKFRRCLEKFDKHGKMSQTARRNLNKGAGLQSY